MEDFSGDCPVLSIDILCTRNFDLDLLLDRLCLFDAFTCSSSSFNLAILNSHDLINWDNYPEIFSSLLIRLMHS
jgi:hypothetical protein